MIKKEIGAGVPLAEIAVAAEGEVVGDSSVLICGLCPASSPIAGGLSMLLDRTKAKVDLEGLKGLAALMISSNYDRKPLPEGVPLLVVKNPLLALRDIVDLFFNNVSFNSNVSEKADIDPTVKLGESVKISPFVVIGANCVIGDRVTLHPNVTIYPGTTIGSDSVIHASAVVREGTILGDRVVVQGGVVIGGEGFGYLPGPDGEILAVPQVGDVKIEDGVEIGANSCVDRGALGDTVIGASTKLDNLVQVGHNVAIGRSSMLCGQVGVAGSAKIGSGVIIGGNAGVGDHVTVADGCRVAGKSGVDHDILTKGDYAGMPIVPAMQWRRQQLALYKLADSKRKKKSRESDE